MESIKTFTLVKMWLVFLDQIKRMTARVLWLYRWAVCASSNETRRQRARSALINIDAEQRFTRGTPEYAFQILKLSDIRHIIQFPSWVKSHKATHTCCPLLRQTLLILQTGPSANHSSRAACFAFCQICCWLNSDGKHIYISKLHRETLFIN